MEPSREKKKAPPPPPPLGAAAKEKKGILRSLSFQVELVLWSIADNYQFSSLGVGRRKESNPYDMTPEEPYEDLGPLHGVQCFGTLLKKYKKKNRPAKWSKRCGIIANWPAFPAKISVVVVTNNLNADAWRYSVRWMHDLQENYRFFVLKECFLIYYSTGFKKTFEKTKRIDLHPKVLFSRSITLIFKGIIPLIGCSIVCGGDVGKKHCLLIAHPQFPSAIIVSAPDHKIQELWLNALRNATKM